MSEVVNNEICCTTYSRSFRLRHSADSSRSPTAGGVFPVAMLVLRKPNWQMLLLSSLNPAERNSFFIAAYFYVFFRALRLVGNVKFAWSWRWRKKSISRNETKKCVASITKKINCLIVTNNSEQRETSNEGSKRRVSGRVAVKYARWP